MRARALEARILLSRDGEFILSSSSAIARHLLDIPPMQNAQTVASYAPSKGEPNPHGFLDLIESAGKMRPRLAFPRVVGKGKLSMHFAAIEDLLPGSFGIPEPEIDTPLVTLNQIDVMLVPGLSFDRQGNRLGYGKGFYDQLLSTDTTREAGSTGHTPLLIGISFEETLIDKVPTESHDIAMDYVVTPERVIKVN